MTEADSQNLPGAEQSEGGPLSEEALRARIDSLRQIRVFSDLPEDELAWFAENTTERRYAAGEAVFRRGDKPDWMAVYLEGEAHILNDENALDDYVYIIRAGDPLTEISGMLPYSRMTEFTVTVRTVVPTRVSMEAYRRSQLKGPRRV